MNKILSFFSNICTLYILLLFLHDATDIFPEGSVLSRIIYWSSVLIGIYCTVVVIKTHSNNRYIKSLTLLATMLLSYGLLMAINENVIFTKRGTRTDWITYTRPLLDSVLPIFSFYYFTIKGYLNEERIKYYIPFFFLIAIHLYLLKQTQLLEANELLVHSAEGVTNNLGYLFATLVPLLAFLYKKPVLQYILLGICAFFVFMSVKRGCIVTFIVCFIIFIMKFIKSTEYRRSKMLYLILITAIIALGSYYLSNILLSDEYFLYKYYKTLEGNASGRNDLYSEAMDYVLNNSSLLELLFGGGANTSVQVLGNYAHNDWLEILLNQGLLGILVYTNYWLGCYQIYKLSKPSFVLHWATTLVFVVIFFKSLFSMSYASVSMFSACAIGLCVGLTYKVRKGNLN